MAIENLSVLGVEGMTSEALRASEEAKSAQRTAAAQDYKKAFFLPKAIFDVIAAKFPIENHSLFWWVEMLSATHGGLE